jgi:phage terminase large subunit
MATLDIKHSIVFERNLEALKDEKYRFIVNQGGSRSSKTWSLCQLLIVYSLTTPGKAIDVIRKTMPTLRASVMRDFFDLMKSLGLYSEKLHNKTENIYRFENGTEIQFFGADDSQKLRGRRRDILWANEANELTFEDFNQLNMRTTDKLFFDFNPSDNFSWLYDLIARENTLLIHSTYKDNPFLNEAQVSEIEYLRNIDENYYRVYALGERGIGKTNIYSKWVEYESLPEVKEVMYGIDFGFNHPTAVIECGFVDNKAYLKEIIYDSGLTSQDLVVRLKELGVPKNKELICDGARPEIIEDLKRAGFLAKSAIKDVKDGIDSVRSTELFIHKESINLLKEMGNYKWKTNGDIILDDPVKVYDDAMDAMRYVIHYWKSKNKRANPNNFKIHF